MAEILEIKYPDGLVGTGPRQLAQGDLFKFICNDAGTVELDFKGHSPFEDGKLIVGQDVEFKAAKPGRYHFDCTLTTPDGVKTKLKGGGELEIMPAG